MAYDQNSKGSKCRLLIFLDRLPSVLKRTPDRPTAPPPQPRSK